MEIEKSKVLIQFLLIFRRSGDVLFFVYARRLRGYTATAAMDLKLLLLEYFQNSLEPLRKSEVEMRCLVMAFQLLSVFWYFTCY